VINSNYKSEIEKLLKGELELCYEILEHSKQFESFARDAELKKADEVLKMSIEKTKELKLFELKIVAILEENNITLENLKDEFREIVSELSEIFNKITELNNKAKVLLNKEKDTILDELKKLKIGKSIYDKYNLDGDKGFIDIVE